MNLEDGGAFTAVIAGEVCSFSSWCDGQNHLFDFGTALIKAKLRVAAAEGPSREASDLLLQAPMAGRILTVDVVPGETIEAGQTLLILEAMKMEHRIRAGSDGIVAHVPAAAGDQVAKNDILIELAG